EWGHGWGFAGRPQIQKAPGSHISAGQRLSLASRSSAVEFGVNHPVVLTTRTPESFIRIGDDVGMSGATLAAHVGITIGNRVLIGANAMIIDSDWHPLEPENRRYGQEGIQAAPIVIEDDVFIGTGAIILKGVTVGQGSVVGAGSVVTRDVPPYSVVAGNPARVVKWLR
ncbi:MAG: acyltransferase, partial [Chloroflexi bacterium]|nr:acyltransferase [Chloroflexota bacterium]